MDYKVMTINIGIELKYNRMICLFSIVKLTDYTE